MDNNALRSNCSRRPNSIPINGAGLPGAIIRDQKPMSDAALIKCLEDGITPTQWYQTLNHKVFFWLSRERLRRLLGAKAYRAEPQVVITLRAESLVDEHQNEILLSPINSGSTIMKPQPRGENTFLPISDYPFDEWRKKRSRKTAVAELTVSGGVTDIMDHVMTVHRIDGQKRSGIVAVTGLFSK